MMATEEKSSEVSASRRRELKNFAKGKGAANVQLQTTKGEEKKEETVVTTSRESLSEIMLAASSLEEVAEYNSAYPDVLTEKEYEDVVRCWKATHEVGDGCAVASEAVAEVLAEIVEGGFISARGAVVVVEPQPMENHLGGVLAMEIQALAPDELLAQPAVETSDVVVEVTVDILADSANAAKQAEIVIRERSHGWTYDSARDEKEKQKRRKLRRPKKHWRKDAESEAEADLPDWLKFKPSEELVQLGLFLEAAAEVLHERWQEAKMFRQLSRRAVAAVVCFREAYEFHLELRKEFRELEARERNEWRKHFAAINGTAGKKDRMDWGDKRRTKKQVVAEKRLIASLGPTPRSDASSVRLVQRDGVYFTIN